ncbi:MAG TPA: NAD(P)H-dependent oxidoreductase [Sulfuricurvum sp.]|nr:NAD(P)H-dependent oxidoreductase [Sulfuricurvum sp.]
MEDKFMEAMHFRHACKTFDASKKISDDDFSKILEYGRLSPSSFGFEPWKFLVIQDNALREKLKAFTWGAQGQLPTASHFVLIASRKKSDMLHGSDYIRHMMRDIRKLPEEAQALYDQFYTKFQEEDFNLLQNDRYLFDWASKQTYIALANMMTGAACMGIDSCPVEGFDFEQTEAFMRDALGVDTDRFGPSVMVAFGYRQEAPKHEKTRQEIKDICEWY